MKSLFDEKLAAGLSAFNEHIRSDSAAARKFADKPTDSVKEFLHEHGVEVPDPATFHAHMINDGESLPDEPIRATVTRSIYVFRSSGLFEFKSVPGSPGADDDFMFRPTGACACCNCCVIQL